MCRSRVQVCGRIDERGRPDNAAMNASTTSAARPLTERDIDRLQAMLDRVPAPLDPLDVCLLDGFLCGVLLQPQPVAAERWLRFVTDSGGRTLPAAFDARPLHALVRRRHAELAAAIEGRQWFDPWVFELDAGDAPAAGHTGPGAPAAGTGPDDAGLDADEAGANPASEAVYPWVAGFALAMEHFPALLALDAEALTAPLALLYRHLGPDDLEDADALLAEIETLAPPEDLSQSVEELVRATLLLADAARPQPGAAVRRGGTPHAPPGARHPRSGRR